MGLAAAAVWGISTILGFEQFGLPTVVGPACPRPFHEHRAGSGRRSDADYADPGIIVTHQWGVSTDFAILQRP